MAEAYNATNSVYASYINKIAKDNDALSEAGVGEFKGCTMTDDTHISCYPYDDFSESDTWYMAIHNPSIFSHKYSFIDVPAGYDFKVQRLGDDGTWSDEVSDVFTYTRTMDDTESTQYQYSTLIMKSEVRVYDVTYIKLEVTKSTETPKIQTHTSQDRDFKI